MTILWKITCFFLVAVLLSVSSIEIKSSNAVTISYQGNYPWLVPGAYADYYADNSTFGSEPPPFASGSGQLLMMTPARLGTPVIADGLGLGQASLNWTVLSRSGDSVLLGVRFHYFGCQDNETAFNIANQTAAPCIKYDFSTGLHILVNLTSDEAFVNGSSQGLLDFWEPPLLGNSSIYDGSVFINGQRFDSVANSSGPLESTGINPRPQNVNVLGTPYSNSVKLYLLIPWTFGVSISGFHVGWLNDSEVAIGGRVQASHFGPSGYYDYYNGLAYEFDVPQFPINQTICLYNAGYPIDCRSANVSTTLGQFFRSGAGILILTSTNVQLTPNSQTMPLANPIVEVAIVVAVAGVLASVAVFQRRHAKRLWKRANLHRAHHHQRSS